MGNIIEYALKSNKSFIEDPFNEVDGLILSQLCYLNLDDYIEKIEEGNFTIKALNENRLESLLKIRVPKQNSKLLKSLAENPRFKDIEIIKYINIKKVEKEIQFSATIYKWGDEGYIAFRGTDSTIVGWKEDFNAMFMENIPSEKKAVKFIEENENILPMNFYIGGHSKGGHLASYAATNIKKSLQDRIIIVFNNDGPGLKQDILDSPEYMNVRDKIMYLLPAQSVFGLILYNNNNYLVVKSDGIWIQQHDPFNWKVLNNCFIYLDEITKYSSINSDTLNRWLEESEPEKRALLVETIYKIIIITNAKKVGDIPLGIFKNYDSVLTAVKQLNKNDLTKISEVLAEYQEIKKQIEKSSPVENEHKADKEIRKFVSKVSKPIVSFIENLPIDEYIAILNTFGIVKKTKSVSKKIEKKVINTAKYVAHKANSKTIEIGENVTKVIENTKKQSLEDEPSDNEPIANVEPVISDVEEVPTSQELKKIKLQKETKKFKEKYFEFYDDIKHYSKGKEDW